MANDKSELQKALDTDWREQQKLMEQELRKQGYEDAEGSAMLPDIGKLIGYQLLLRQMLYTGVYPQPSQDN